MDAQPATETKTHNEYTVGWVCALPKEQTAATAMLDQRHGSLPKPANDSNTYTLGSIGKHNVVIACLPKGHIGNNPAATVAAQMVSTFPSIRFGLMIGIGGGIPPKVRLGDVVVSTPVGSFPGVVQWDRGTAKDGSFERTGSLNNPPPSLLTALARLETEHELVGSKIPEYLDQLKQKWPRLAANYLKSDLLEDILFKTDYSHVCQSITGEHISFGSDYESEKEESCRYCDKTKVVKRKPRDMRVHYGLIASGNQVIKSATRRDQLNKDLGGNLLCVEMEAAGLMNNFPCIVVRGICDYADSHKNKDWQKYAAAVAASFAKELLDYVQPRDVDGERTVKDVLGDVLTHVSVTKADVSYIKSRLDNDEDLQILEWITSTDYGPQHSDFLKKRQPGTGQWLLDSTEYQTWLGARYQTLFCPGIPGAGKTILTSIVVDHLERTYRADPTIGIAYFYCNYRRQEEQSIERLLTSLLKQLSRRQNSLLDCLRDFYKDHVKKGKRPTLDEIQKVLRKVVEAYSTGFIVVDALDECQNLDGSRQKFLTKLFSLQERYGWNLFMTSRVIPEIVDRFSKTSISLEIRASTEDIERYLKGNIGQLPAFVQQNQELQQKIAAEISKAVDGMFLLAQIYLDSLNDKMTPKAIKHALNSFQKPISGVGEAQKAGVLAHAYEQAMERIHEQQSGFKELAHKVLSWIVFAERQLTTTELQHALAVEIGELELDKENLSSIQDMVSVCAGLVTVDYESNIIRLVHYTTQEYFNQTRTRWFPDADLMMADTCVSYLLFKAFEEGACPTDDDFRERSRLYPLYSYAAQNWGHHVRKATKLCHKVMEFLACETKVDASVEAFNLDPYDLEDWDEGEERPVYEMTSLHLAAYFGIEEAVKVLLKKTIDVNTEDETGSTALSWSACNGHETVVNLLLAVPYIEVNSGSGGSSDTPLPLAAGNGHEAVVNPLLTMLTMPSIDIDIYPEGNRLGTPLYRAASNGHDVVVTLLLAAGADPNFGNAYQTPLTSAAWNGHEAVVKLLLAMPSIDIHLRHPRWGTPLFRAAGEGHDAVMKLLLTAGADPNIGRDGETPLFTATEKGHEAVVKLLLAAGADPNISKNGQTPLFNAVEKGHEAVVKLLLAIPSIDIDLSQPFQGPPLFKAAQKGHNAVVKLLLAAGAEPDLGNNVWTPLTCAAGSGDVALAEMLLAAGADPYLEDSFGATPLMVAASRGHDAVIKLMLAARADVNLSLDDTLIGSALCRAASEGREVVVELLLAAGVNPDLSNTDGITPLWYAIDRGSGVVMKALLAAGADPNLIGKDGTTPLSHAVHKGDEVLVMKELLAAGADPNLVGKDGKTPLLHAAYNGDEVATEMLLAAGASLDFRAKYGHTPLLLAAVNGHKVVVDLLLAAGANPDLSDEDGVTPLWWAADLGCKYIAEMLLAAGASPDFPDKYGHTPLLHAAREGHEVVVKLLLAAGANPDLRDKQGQTPLSVAKERGHEALVKLLSNKGAVVDLMGVARQRVARQRVAKQRVAEQKVAKQRVTRQRVAKQRVAKQRAAGQSPFI